MLTFLDVVQKENFRESVVNRLRTGTENFALEFPSIFPRLHRYRSLSKYAVDDIINHTATATSIGSFNDLFDGTIHKCDSKEEIEQAAEREWCKLEELRQKAGLPGSLLSHDYYTKLHRDHLRTESRLLLRLSDYLGTYVACFSTKNDSVLMWAHYADSQKGICIAYDFNQWEQRALQRKLLFPVVYSDIPVDVSDLVGDQNHTIAEYPVDEALLCAAINKSAVWKYESEWRLIAVMTTSDRRTLRVPLEIFVNPVAIYLGYHFLKQFFYFDHKSRKEIEQAMENLNAFNKLIDFVIGNKIPIFVMLPKVRSYGLKEMEVDSSKLKIFVNEKFKSQTPVDIYFYNTIHDKMIDFFEEER